MRPENPTYPPRQQRRAQFGSKAVRAPKNAAWICGFLWALNKSEKGAVSKPLILLTPLRQFPRGLRQFPRFVRQYLLIF